ncbi:MAG: type II secretion system GspH family protein [Lentisphaerales bacterium]|nr:type II secretion system GspH family protein [Lentisphaerales bacterium]
MFQNYLDRCRMKREECQVESRVRENFMHGLVGEVKLIPRRSFTFIELMAIIAIIGILVTILAPSLSLAREKSMATVCQMRQCGMAINMYLDDWDDWMPAVNGYVRNSQLGWRNSLVLYMDGTDTTKAPFEFPSANLSFNSPNQETGTSYNKEFGDSRFGNWPPKKNK